MIDRLEGMTALSTWANSRYTSEYVWRNWWKPRQASGQSILRPKYNT